MHAVSTAHASNKIQQKSPAGHLENVDLEDYDEETDEFAGYSGSQAHLHATQASSKAKQDSAQSQYGKESTKKESTSAVSGTSKKSS